MANIEALKLIVLKDIPSIQSNEMLEYIKNNRYPVITVKFTTLDQDVFTQSYSGDTTILQVKRILADIFHLSTSEKVVISQHGTVAKDDEALISLIFNKHHIMELDLQSTDPTEFIAAHNAYKSYTVPDIITVTVVYDDCTCEDFVVEIENRSILKPFLGGYRNKITQIEYNHGYTQTGAHVKKDAKKTTQRTTQTNKMRNRKQNTSTTRYTQMSRADYYIPSVTDVVLTAGKYESSLDRSLRIDIEGAVRTIQRYYRAWRLRQALKLLIEEYRKRVRLEQEEIDELHRLDEDRKRMELIGRIFPRTKNDFFMLYHMLEQWKKLQIKKIQEMACGPSKIAQMYLLLEREIDMLMSIEKKKMLLNKDRAVKREMKFLKEISTPLMWNSEYKDLKIEMDTLETQAGRQYVELFKRVCDAGAIKGKAKIDECLKVYLDVKLSLNNHIYCSMARDILTLIDRVCLLIGRGLTDGQLIDRLHRRIQASLLKHYHMPECNQNIALRAYRLAEKRMKNNLFYCQRCKKLRLYEEFNLVPSTKKLTVCKNCSVSDKILEPWRDLQPYRFLLKLVRRDERRYSSHCSIAFILSDVDIYHIVTQIWQSHSLISETNDVHKLRLCRFFKDLPWAPWNCILLTAEEAHAHLTIKDVAEVYDESLLGMVYQRHLVAKKFFKGVIQLNDYFQEMGNTTLRWDEIKEVTRFEGVNSKETIFLSCH